MPSGSDIFRISQLNQRINWKTEEKKDNNTKQKKKKNLHRKNVDIA